MALRPLLQFQNPDSTRDINDRSRVFNKGVFSGGAVQAGTVADGLAVRLEAFATSGADGMFVQETADTNLAVVDGVRNFIVLRSIYRDNAAPTVQVESMPEATYLADPELEFLVVFAVVDIPLSNTFVTQAMIFYQEADIVDPLGRLSLRGTLTNAGDLPNWNNGNANVSNTNRAGDFYTITSGEDDVPEMYVWSGSNTPDTPGRWVNVTQAQVLVNLLNEHIANLSDNAKHLSNTQFEAVLGSSGVPSNSNRFVTEADARLPTFDENAGMTGDPTILSGDVDEGVENYRGREAHEFNQFTLNSKIFAVPAEKAFPGGAVIEIQEADGPVYVGKDVLGTAQRWFNIFATDTTGNDRDKEYLNSQARPCIVTGVFTEASLTDELDPGSHIWVDANGFWRVFSEQGNPAGSLYLQLSGGDVDGQADTDFRIAYGQRTTMEQLLPQAFLSRGPQFGQVDTRLNQLLATDTSPDFRDSEWDGGTSPGDVIAFDSGAGQMVQSNIPFNLFPVGIRGNANNLIQDGIYEFPAPTIYTAGNEVWADLITPGALTTTPNDRFVGTFLSDTKLLVSMNSIALSATSSPPGQQFPGSFFQGVSPNQAVGWNDSISKFVPWTTSVSFAPEGLSGNANNVIQNGLYTPGGSPYVNGTRYYARTIGGSPGDLTASQNEYYIGRAIGADQLFVNSGNSPNWEIARTTFAIEHDANFGTHLEGSARGWSGLEADRFAASNSQTQSTGMLYYATDTGRVFYCTNGLANTWVEQSRFTGPVGIDGALDVGGLIEMPTKQLFDGGSDTMNPFVHAFRHFAGGADPLSGLVQQIIAGGSTTPTTVSGAGPFLIQSVAFDLTGRAGNSQFVFFSSVHVHNTLGGSGTYTDVTVYLAVDGVELLVPNGIRSKIELNGVGGIDDGTLTQFGWRTDLSPGAHTIELWAFSLGIDPEVEDRMIMGLDLGLT